MKAAFSLAVVALATTAAVAGWKDDIGYTSLEARLGAATPTGNGIAASQVESASSGNYLPDLTSSEFAGKTLNPKNGVTGVSSHAQAVAQHYYGLVTSIAPGIDPADIWEANGWLQSSFLKTYTSSVPVTETRRLNSQSWIGSFGVNAYDNDALRRVDLVAQRDGVIFTVGVNNGAGTAVPKLLASAYNPIAVGVTPNATTGAGSSYGPTLSGVDGAGRCKPDIIAPVAIGTDAAKVSWSTPTVAAAAALLLETADDANDLPSLTGTPRRVAFTVVAKSLLMCGATKEELPDWRRGFATPSTDGTVPLDYRYGAGELNIDNSHRILTAGQQAASAIADVLPTGWDFRSVSSASPQSYFFEVPLYRRIERLSVVVAWNRTISVGGGVPRTLTPSLANIDLKLYRAAGYAKEALRDQSISSVDNVEHMYQSSFAGGRYALEVTTNQTADYAIAWDVQTAADVAPDLDDDGDVDLDDFAALTLCFNGAANPPGAANCMADFDGDGDVDIDDFSTFSTCFNGATRPPACL